VLLVIADPKEYRDRPRQIAATAGTAVAFVIATMILLAALGGAAWIVVQAWSWV
jgi:hypothetical protein